MKRILFSAVLIAGFLGFNSVKQSHAECKEYKIVDHGDSVEAVCIGTPLTAAQQKELDKQKAQESKAQQESSQNKKPSDSTDVGNVVVKSYDIKYIPSNKITRKGIQLPGDYSVKIDAKNSGRQGSVVFKIKLTDSSGFEIESTSFREHFERDEYKTVTTHFRARRVPLMESSDWTIGTTKQK